MAIWVQPNAAYYDFSADMAFSSESMNLRLVRFTTLLGVRDTVQARLRVNQQRSLKTIFSWDDPDHDIVGALNLVLTWRDTRHEKSKTHGFGKGLRDWFDDLSNAVITLIGFLMDRYVVHYYMIKHHSSKPAPAYVSPKKRLQQRKAYTTVHPEAV